MSASTSSTRDPPKASAMAMFAAVVVFPSSGCALARSVVHLPVAVRFPLHHVGVHALLAQILRVRLRRLERPRHGLLFEQGRVVVVLDLLNGAADFELVLPLRLLKVAGGLDQV